MENTNKKKEFLKSASDDRYLNLKETDNQEFRGICEEDIKHLKLWLREFDEPASIVEKRDSFLMWKIDFLKEELKFVKEILKMDPDLTEEQRAELEREADFIKAFIDELGDRK